MIDKSKWPKAGETWRARDGRSIFKVTESDNGMLVCFEEGIEMIFTPSGRFYASGGENCYDLVEKVEQMPKDDVQYIARDGRGVIVSRTYTRDGISDYNGRSEYSIYRCRLVYEERVQ